MRRVYVHHRAQKDLEGVSCMGVGEAEDLNEGKAEEVFNWGMGRLDLG